MNTPKEYTFKIDAYTINTMPMARLAKYLAELCTILGEPSSVHFVRLDEGSVRLVHKIDHEAIPKVEESIKAVRNGQGTVVQMEAYKRVNRMLDEDNTGGVLMEETEHEVIKFPGKREDQAKTISIPQQGEIDGELIRIGGAKDTVHLTLTIEGEETKSNISVKRDLAKKLAKHLFDYVRLYGQGRWERNGDGEWDMVSFQVDRFEVLQDKTLSQTILALRELKGEWGENAVYDILESRRSKKSAH